MDGEKCETGDSGDYESEENHDEPGGSIGILGRRLGDSHCVDEGARDEANEVHVSRMLKRANSIRDRRQWALFRRLHRGGWGAHLLIEGLPEQW